MKIHNSTKEDIPEIFRLYKLATDFQKIKFPENQWPQFENGMIAKEVHEKRQFKLTINGKIACVWAIAYSDPQIWVDAENENSIFIHRIATNPEYRGQAFVKIIVGWALELAKTENKQFIRMDTCGKNEVLIQHYQNCGFKFLGIKKLQNTSNLPSHYQNADVCFFEIEVE